MRAGELAAFILRRLLHAIPLLILVAVVNFALISATPGDPAVILVGDYPAPPGYVEQIRHQFGLDQPLPVQIWRYLSEVARGNLGYSFANRQPVASLIVGRLGATLELTLTALALACVLGVALGALASRRPGRPLDVVIQAISSVGHAVPEFWLGQILVLVFALALGWLPTQGSGSLRGHAEGWAGMMDRLRFLVLPALALSFRYLALIARITRASLIEVMGSDYILASRSRGSSEWAVLVRHGLRNAAAPVLTVVGYNLGFVLAGSALIETVFAWPGIGRLLFDSISVRDYPVMLGILLLISATVILANLVTDILHRLLDPRISG